MNIIMFTNTFTPHVGGVARSVERFTDSLREKGHRVLVVAPEFKDHDEEELDVYRVPAIQNFNGSDFSFGLPVLFLDNLVEKDFELDIVHAHHPYLLGDTALRYSARVDAPMVFTHHTMYEQYTHYVPGDSPAMQRFVVELSTGFANMCDRVVAPSESVRDILQERGVETEIKVVPTGVDIDFFSSGKGKKIREKFDIPPEAFVVGHLGRLAPEKNLEFLCSSVFQYLQNNQRAHFLVTGNGPSREKMEAIASEKDLSKRVHFTGSLGGKDVVDVYHAMDVFAFSSKSETQGMVLTEAMAAGVPVVALNASGVREVLENRENNGIMVNNETTDEFSSALREMENQLSRNKDQINTAVRETAVEYSIENCTEKLITLYEELKEVESYGDKSETTGFDKVIRRLDQEWQLWSNRVSSVAEAIVSKDKNSEEIET